MKPWNWLLVFLVILGCLAINFMFTTIPFVYKLGNVLLFGLLLLVIRIVAGPTAADRLVALNVFALVMIGVCVFVAVSAHVPHFIDIAVTWAIQSFIATIALAKLLEGRPLDD